MTDFATLVEEYRGKKQITKTELTQRSGLSSGYISLLTRGARTSPSEETVARIADALMLDAESRVRLFKAAGYHSATVSPSLHEFNSAYQDWGDAPDAHVLFGRDQELEKLKRLIVNDGCRLVAILGPGGVGKTILAAKLAEKVQDSFVYIVWRSLQNALPLDDFLRECIQFLSNQRYNDIPGNTDKQISLLIECLQTNRCLLVLDNFETILQDNSVGRYRGGYEGYGKLLQRVGEGRHQSCLLLTSREKSKEIAKLEGSTFPVKSLTLGGLQFDEGKEFLKDKGLHGTEENWQNLIDYYSGNPLALMVVSQFIEEVFGGDIANFLKGGGVIFSDIRDVLDEQFNRLSSLEQEIMYWLAIEREPVSPDDLMNIIARPLPREDLLEALNSLGKRSMIEDRAKPLFTLQPVIMEYTNKKFVNHVYTEISLNEHIFLTNYALIKASVKDYIRNTQIQLILKPIAQRLSTELGQDGSENVLKAVLSDLQKSQPLVSGYAAGNVLNLLISLNADLRGYNFSNLVVWEAYLRGISLRYVNFTSSDLSRSAFTDTFGSIFSVALNMTGELLAAGTANGEIRIWTTREARSYNILKGHTEWVRSVAFSPRRNILVSGSEDQTIRVWDVETGDCLNTLRGHTSTVYSVVFSPDSQIIGSGSDDQTIRLWELSTGNFLRHLVGHESRIFSIAFSPDGRTIASGSGDRTVRLWDVDNGTCLKTLRGHTDWIWSVAFSPTKNILASGGDDKTRLWNVETGECLRILESGRVYSIVFSPDGDTIACGSEGQAVRLLDVKTGLPLKTLRGYGSRIYSVAFHPKEDIIVSGGEDGMVRLWHALSNQNVRELYGHTHWVWSVCFSPNDVILASASEDRTIRLWNADTGECLNVLHGHANRVFSVAFSPDGKLLASSSGDQTVKLWDVSSGDLIRTLEEQHSKRIYSVAFSPDGKLLASSSGDQTVKLWDVSSGDLIRTLLGHTNHVRSVAFSPDGNTLVSGGDDKKVMIWDSNTGLRINTLEGHDNWIRSVVFSPDGNTIASSSEDKTVRLWDTATGDCLNTHKVGGGAVYSVAFNHTGSTIATGSHEGIIEIWDIRANERVSFLRSDRPYEGMKIANTKGLSDSERTILKDLGAVEDESQS